MEKVLRRAKYAEKQATKRASKRAAYLENTEAWQRTQSSQRIRRNLNNNIVAARRNRAEDWKLGPLAPRRDIGEKAANYGSMSIYDFNLPELGEKEKVKYAPLVEGDRVVIVKGREKGKIGAVTDVSDERNGVRVTGLNVVDVDVPKWMAQQSGNEHQLNAISRYIPFEHVRLVYPLPDPVTGVPRDVVIDELEFVNVPHQERQNEHQPTYDRVIPGTNTIIPWPEPAISDPETYDVDTAAISLEDRSFRPYLLAAPMPLSVIDELRGKYSKFRTRHDAEYVEKKEAEAERVLRRKDLGKSMRTPLQELAELRAKQKKEAERELSDEQLARIGEVIEREEARALGEVREMSGQQRPEVER